MNLGLVRKAAHRTTRRLRELWVSMKIEHLCGPRHIRLAPNEAVVTCVVKNGGFYIEEFIAHYLKLGCRHIFLLDNGSTDQTLDICKQNPNVTVFTSSLPIDANQAHFKRYLARNVASGGWCLDADIDEFLDFPLSAHLPFNRFLEYLNKNGFTGVITQLLDMFSNRPFSELVDASGSLASIYCCYDIGDVTKTVYHDSAIAKANGSANRVTHPDTCLFWGGIRRTLYGNNCLLTKHSLFRLGKGVKPFPHVHFMDNVALADVSCVMRHYKLTSNAIDVANQNREHFTTNSKGYDDFIGFLKEQWNSPIEGPNVAKWNGVDELVNQGFLFVSENYRNYVSAQAGTETTRTKRPVMTA